MPSSATIEKFIARVEENKHDDAILEFYTENASMRENHDEPRVGRAALVARERQVLSRVSRVESRCIHPVFVNGDYMVIRWIFRFDYPDGSYMEMEELAYQRWEGERIAEEQFFYDPVQRKPKRPDHT